MPVRGAVKFTVAHHDHAGTQAALQVRVSLSVPGGRGHHDDCLGGSRSRGRRWRFVRSAWEPHSPLAHCLRDGPGGAVCSDSEPKVSRALLCASGRSIWNPQKLNFQVYTCCYLVYTFHMPIYDVIYPGYGIYKPVIRKGCHMKCIYHVLLL